MTVRLLIGDVHERLGQLPDDSVDLALTSPPFLALRSYLPADHILKRYEIGAERTPAEFIDTLLAVTAELGRVLAPHGSLCVELGDTYAGSGGAGGDYRPGGLRGGQPAFGGSGKHARRQVDGYERHPVPDMFKGGGPGGVGWPLPKSLTGIPTLYAWSLAYGFNLLTGKPSPAGQWRIRNLVHWVRPNPPPGALGDKFRPGTSYLVVACKSGKRWFDLDAVRTPHTEPQASERLHRRPTQRDEARREVGLSSGKGFTAQNPAGAPPLDWWRITARGYKGSHYAVFPPDLCERPVKSMCPPRVCLVCGEPSRRLTQVTYTPHGDAERHNAEPKARADYARQQRNENAQGMAHGRATKHVETVGWSDCGHGAWRPGVVLDPFAGTGTALLVAAQNDRDAIGIDIDARNAFLAYQRLAAKGVELDIDYGLTANDVLMSAA